MDASGIDQTIKAYIVRELLEGDGTDLDEHTPLLEIGILDSMTMVTLMSHVEEVFGVSIPVESVTPRNFQSIAALRNLILELSDESSTEP